MSIKKCVCLVIFFNDVILLYQKIFDIVYQRVRKMMTGITTNSANKSAFFDFFYAIEDYF